MKKQKTKLMSAFQRLNENALNSIKGGDYHVRCYWKGNPKGPSQSNEAKP